MKRHLHLAGMFAVLILLLFISNRAAAQTPDTVYRKPTLPTGPPVPAEQPARQPQPVKRPQPLPQEQPEVVRQQDEAGKPALMDRLYFGGGLGLQFGTFTNISLLPILGYRITDRFSAGVGAVYHFVSYSSYSYSNYGGRVFTQAELFDIGDGAILAHGEVEVLNAEYNGPGSYLGGGFERRSTVAFPMVGLGYRQRIGERASFDLLVLYNTNDASYYNPYNNPVFRAGINIPFRK
ncbi:hypothetical protein [Pontibacter sp. 172403-2]|uniref:hypothetical protein n=1 Tax=Pontibacter rufus TaxID=2791028 RepID=UPI001E2D523A|nr:hypothetical protein [Pontibacter sp. 172403-2]